MWAGRFNDRVVPDPHILTDVNASPPVEQHARSCGARCNSSEHLKNPIFKLGSRRSDIRSLFQQNDISSASSDIYTPIKTVCSLRGARCISDERSKTPLVLKTQRTRRICLCWGCSPRDCSIARLLFQYANAQVESHSIVYIVYNDMKPSLLSVTQLC